MTVPKLRFKEFDGEWKEYKLEEVVKVIDGDRGKNYPSGNDFSTQGHTLFLSAANVTKKGFSFNKRQYITQYKSESMRNGKLEENDIVLTTRGSLGHVAWYNCNVKKNIPFARINSGMLILRSNKNISSMYISQFLVSPIGKRKIEIINFGSAQPQLTKKDIQKYKLIMPEFIEQQKIGFFFQQIDKKIQLQQEKIDLLKEQKKGYMQKLFNQELRFKNEHGQDFPEWKKQIKAEKLFESISNKKHNGEYPVLSATQEHGIVYRDLLDRQMSFNDDNLISYKLVEPKDFIISLRSFQGGIEFSNLKGLVSPAYTVFRKKSEFVNELYFSKVFKTENFIMRLNTTTYGIRDGKAISYKDFSTLKFDVPCLEEQIKIAKFLDVFDKKIAHEINKLTQLTYQKQYFMQQMFI